MGTGLPRLWLWLWSCLALALPLGGCERFMADMYKQPKYKPGEPAPLFADRQGTRPPPPGTVAHAEGDVAQVSSGRRGVLDDTASSGLPSTPWSTSTPPSMALLKRGQERYGIFCMPCHGPIGNGDGPVARRGFPAPPTYHQDRLRQAPDSHLYEVITHGHGLMYGYGDRISAEDRRAIIAFVRALQLSQHAPVAALPESIKAQLAKAPVPTNKPRAIDSP
jgi:mono/diheme cytochrome c family protein